MSFLKINAEKAVLFSRPWVELCIPVYPETVRRFESKEERLGKVCRVVDANVVIGPVTCHFVIIEAKFEARRRYRRWRRFSVLYGSGFIRLRNTFDRGIIDSEASASVTVSCATFAFQLTGLHMRFFINLLIFACVAS